eukprot:SAG11_NODE_29121_length_314_cov_0.911628_1_plen_28_part_10
MGQRLWQFSLLLTPKLAPALGLFNPPVS